MRIAAAIALASWLWLPHSAHAQSSSVSLTGLGEMRTAEILPEDGSRITLVPGRYHAQYGDVGKRVGIMLGFTQGWGDRFEAGLQVPYLVHGDDDGLSASSVAAKVRFYDRAGVQLAVNGGLELPTASKENEYGTGTAGLEGGVLGSFEAGGGVRLDGSFSYGTTDYCPRCSIAGAQLPEPRSVPAVRAAGGVSVSSAKTGHTGFVQLHALKANNGVPGGQFDGDPDWYALAGGRLRLPVRAPVFATAYVGGGVRPQGSANTRAVAAVMLQYEFDSGLGRKRSRPVVVATPAPTPAPVVVVATPVPSPTATPRPPVIVVFAPTPAPTATPPPVWITKVKVTEKALEIAETIQFLTGSAKVDSESFDVIDAIAEALKAHPEVKLVRIEGHTDSTGPAATNLRLSTQRAVAVRDLLIHRGVDPSRLQAQGLGESQPLTDDDTPDGRVMNRRVEIEILKRE